MDNRYQEEILGLKPDVILGTTKFKPEVSEKLEPIAPTILYSHVSTNWESNLLLLGELSGKKKEGEDVIAKYKTDLEEAKVGVFLRRRYGKPSFPLMRRM